MKYNHALKIKGLNLQKGLKLILRDYHLTVRAGQAIKVSGPNGCGKTSLLRTIARLNRIHEGELLVTSSIETRPLSANLVNFIGHSPSIAWDLTIKQYLTFYSKITEGKVKYHSIEESLDIFKIRTPLQLSRNLSAGQKQRLSLCKLLLFEAPIWVLDEPFNSLDVESQEILEKQIESHLENNGIVFLTCHQTFNLEEKFKKIYLEQVS